MYSPFVSATAIRSETLSRLHEMCPVLLLDFIQNGTRRRVPSIPGYGHRCGDSRVSALRTDGYEVKYAPPPPRMRMPIRAPFAVRWRVWMSVGIP
jgi:hypothetical protein